MKCSQHRGNRDPSILSADQPHTNIIAMNSLGVVLISVLLLGAGSLSVGISDSIAKCEDPGRPVNGHRRVISAAGIDRERELFVWSRVRFWCKEGYRLRGERELECRPSLVDDGAGQWSAPLSICVPHYNLRKFSSSQFFIQPSSV